LIKRVYWRVFGTDAKAFYARIVGFTGKVFWEMDHVLERALNPDDSLGNLQTLCMGCHRHKTTMFMREQRSLADAAGREQNTESRRKAEAKWRRQQIADEEKRFRHEVAMAEREILESRGYKMVPLDPAERAGYVLDFVHNYIDGQIAKNGYWPKTLEPIPSDYEADLRTIGGD